MRDTIYGQADLVLIGAMNDAQLGKFLNGLSAKQALNIRRNLQVSLAVYSKKHPAIGRLDQVQGSVILICKKIEEAVRNAYTLQKWRKIKAQYPNMSALEKQERKNLVKANWEKFIKAHSY